MLPWADEIVGKLQFDRLCSDAIDVNIYGTIPIGEALYLPDGRWRLSSIPPLPLDEFNRRQAILESLIKYENTELQTSSIGIHIGGRETRILSKKDDRLLASYRIYGTRGGWISQNFEKPTFVRDQCLPHDFATVTQRILPFDGRKS